MYKDTMGSVCKSTGNDAIAGLFLVQFDDKHCDAVTAVYGERDLTFFWRLQALRRNILISIFMTEYGDRKFLQMFSTFLRVYTASCIRRQ
jgi:hypothetical protein